MESSAGHVRLTSVVRDADEEEEVLEIFCLLLAFTDTQRDFLNVHALNLEYSLTFCDI